MKKESCFEKILPWKSLSGSELSKGNKRIDEVGLIILENQDMSFDEALQMTFFSHKREIERGSVCENSIFIDRAVQEKLELNLGDELLVSISENDKISFIVGGIFENTSYSDKYTCMIFFTESIKKAFENTYGIDWLSGAYILGSSKEAVREYFNKKPYYPEQYFIDMTKDKNKAERNEFEKAIKQKDWSKLVEDRVKKVSNYSQNGTYKNAVIIMSSVVSVFVLILSMVLFVFRYIKSIQSTYNILLILGENKSKAKLVIFGFIWLSLVLGMIFTVIFGHILFVYAIKLIHGLVLTTIMLIIGLIISFFSVFIGISVGYLKSNRV
ncbi:hypothetical protein [uncultured Eubacterium sp.]|uniref:hypothetical protein n=1 Tax=uncultured Eubacterium sp. TaxID=165185 RepID=UPI002673B300|nr:hypothetical protein [uncultured Eubacterium sp.]